MIQNILTFCVKNDLTYVSGSIPSGKLVANDINRNSIYLITPYDEAIVKANFQTNLQSDTPTSVLGILVNGEIEVSELVDINASYYNLVKDWNIYEFKVPSTTLSFISRNRTGKIGINFSIEQRLVPMIKVSYGAYKGEITELAQTPTEDGYYIIKALGYEYEDSIELKSFDLNDILVYNATTDVATKISAYSNRGSTPTAMYSVDPSLLNDNFETIDSGLTPQIVQQVNDNTSDILLLNQGVLNDGVAITDLQNRMSVAESDIDTAENNIVNLQGRMATAESDIDKIENGTTIVEKALRDSLGNIIKDSYVSAVYPTYNSTTDKLFIETYSVEDGLLANNEVVLPKATTTKNGLMAKEDKVKVDNIAGDISSAITNHDNSAIAHLSLRTLINNLQQEIDRLNAKGRSWGEIDKTYSELVAMGEPTASEYISDYLAVAFGHTPAEIGDLIYTKVSATEPEYEMEFNGSLWVSNGAYLVSKANNTQMGLVQGDLTYVSILDGIIQVLKSDYATNVGSSGASYDYADLLALFTEVANDIYKKNETYSATQIEQRITDLLTMANLQDVLIGSYTNGQTVLASDLSAYNFVVALGKDVNNAYTGFFKPSEIVSGNVISLSSTVYLTRGATNYTITTPTSIKLWGIKLDGITASEISYDGTISGLSSTNMQDVIGEVIADYMSMETDNLFNTKNVIDGKLVAFAPTTYPNYLTNYATSIISGFVSVEENKNYVVVANNGLFVGSFVFVDENKYPVCGSNVYGSANYGSWNSKTGLVDLYSVNAKKVDIKILVGSNIKYMLFYLTTTNNNNYYGVHTTEDLKQIVKNFQVNEGTVQKDYQPNPLYVNEAISINDKKIEDIQNESSRVYAYKQGNTIYLRSEFNDTKDIVHKIDIKGSQNGSFNYTSLYTVEKSLEKYIIPETGTTFKVVSDDITPISYNEIGFIGGNHGVNAFTEITFSTNHNFTTMDIGEYLVDSVSNNFVLVRIDNTNKIIVGKEGINIVDSTKPLTSLTLGSSTFTISSATTIQLRPSINNVSVNVYNENYKEVVENGVYKSNKFIVIERYDIINAYDMLQYLKSNIGTNTNSTYYSNLITSKMCEIFNTYTFTEKGSVTENRVATNKVSRWQTHSGLQSGNIGNYYSVPLSNKNLITLQSGQVDINEVDYTDPNYVPNSFFSFSDITGKKGFSIGFNEMFGSAENTTRLSKTTKAIQYNSSGKSYPELYKETAAVNEVIGYIGYRTFFDNQNESIPCVSWYYVNNEVYVLIYSQNSVDDYVKLPNYMIGKEIIVSKTDGNIQIPMNFISNQGLRIKITDYGFAIIKLIN